MSSPLPLEALQSDRAPAADRIVRIVAAAVALIPAIVAVTQLGRLHPDEVFQTLEPANHRAFGYGIVAWEWTVGLRNWAVPGLFSWILEAGAALGINDPMARRILLELPQLALHFATLLAVYRLTVRRLPARLALASMVLVGLYGPLIHFAGRPMGESFSAAFLVIALERIDAAPGKPWHVPAFGGALLGFAVVTRYGSAVMVIAALVWLVATRAWKPLLYTVLGGLVVALALGGLDWATWGAPFHSLRKYVDFNLLSGEAVTQFGSEPAWFYLPLLGCLVLWAWPGLVLGVLRRAEGASIFAFCGLAYVAAISLTPHKEARFLYPGLVLLLVAATPPWLALLSRLAPKRTSLLLTASLVSCVAILFFKTPYQPERPDMFRLVVKASREATGLVIVGEGVWGAPGYFYLGKNIPWFPCDFAHDGRFIQAMATPAYNRAVIYDDSALAALEQAGFKVLEVQDRSKLLGR
jgi:GPI mannosyltransferase 3